MQTLSEIRRLLGENGLAPRKSLGQCFLIDQNLVAKLVDAAGVAAGDTVLEVGPGTGTLTEELLARGARVVACELDDRLAALLARRAAEAAFPGAERLAVVHADCLESKQELSAAVRAALAGVREFKLVSNLPYGAGTPLIMTLLVHHPECRTLAVTVQREVADRLLAPPGSPVRGVISLIAQAACRVERVATLPRECFWPRPEVTSAMLLLRRRDDSPAADLADLAEFSRTLFAHRRKQIGGLLPRGTAWTAGVAPTMRAEALTVEQVRELMRAARNAD